MAIEWEGTCFCTSSELKQSINRIYHLDAAYALGQNVFRKTRKETMRDELQKLNGQRMRFRATVERYGSRSNWHGHPEMTILLRDVCFAGNGELACDHLWFRYGGWTSELEIGTTFEFDARVDSYI